MDPGRRAPAAATLALKNKRSQESRDRHRSPVEKDGDGGTGLVYDCPAMQGVFNRRIRLTKKECRLWVFVTAACSPHTCGAGLACRSEGGDGWHCRRPLENGSPCGEHEDCETGYCHRDDYDAVCHVESPWWTLCDASPCEGCGVCRPEPTVAVCVDTL